LQHFSSVESHQFAIIKVGGAVLTDDLDTLASSLTFLQRVGLYPIVVHGAGPQLNELLDKAGIEAKYDEVRTGGMDILFIRVFVSLMQKRWKSLGRSFMWKT
jgi:acetylglutamate kinase